jgi:hypothetical protein
LLISIIISLVVVGLVLGYLVPMIPDTRIRNLISILVVIACIVLICNTTGVFGHTALLRY